MKFVVIFVVTFYCLYHHATGNQQPDDPNKPFWAARGRRSGQGYMGRASIKADDSIPERWADDDALPEIYEKDQLLRKKERTISLLSSILNALSTWDSEGKGKRGDGKVQDPNNPFWAARG